MTGRTAVHFCRSLERSVCSPLFFLCAVLFAAVCSFYYFFVSGFFSGNAVPDIRFFFAAFPYVSIVVIPLLCFPSGDKSFVDAPPLSPFARTFFDFILPFARFVLILLPLVLVPLCTGFFGDIDTSGIIAGFAISLSYGAAAVSLAVFFYTVFSPHRAFIVSAACFAFAGFASLSETLRPLSFAYRADAAAKGIVDTRDIVFFCTISAFFLFAAFIASEKKRRIFFPRNERCMHVVILLIIVFASLNGKRYYARIDLTKNKTFSLSDYGKKTLSRLTSPLTITYYRSPRIASVYPSSRDVYEYVKMYARENSAVNVAVKDPDASGVSDVLNRFGILPQTFRSGKGDEVSLFSALVFEYEGEIQTIPFIVSADRIEYDLTRCVKNFVDGSRPRVLILTGNGMTLSEDYSYVVPWLSLQGFDCIEIEARTLSDYAGGDILIVFGASKLSDKDAAAIEAFVLSGGSALFAVSPYDADIKSTWSIERPENTALIELLSFWGISFESALVLSTACAFITLASGEAGQGTGQFESIGYPLWISIPPQDEAKRGLTLFWASPVKIENASAKPLLVSSPSSWVVRENLSGGPLFKTNPFSLQKVAPDRLQSYAAGAYFDGELSGMYVPEKKEASRIAVVADQYFAASLPLSYIGGETGDYRNLDFLTHVVLKLTGDKGLAELQNKGSVRTLYKTPDAASFSAARKKTLAVAFILVPLFYAALVLFSAAMQKRRFNYLSRIEM